MATTKLIHKQVGDLVELRDETELQLPRDSRILAVYGTPNGIYLDALGDPERLEKDGLVVRVVGIGHPPIDELNHLSSKGPAWTSIGMYVTNVGAGAVFHFFYRWLR